MAASETEAVAGEVDQTTSVTQDDGAEIDRIMQEIEELEKKMDEVDAETQASKPEPVETSSTSQGGDNVIPLRGALDGLEATSDESLAETDAVPAADEPLMKSGSDGAGDGALALKVGGCTEISLEFARAGVTITLSCTADSLSISTDQGAEFRIPFKAAA